MLNKIKKALQTHFDNDTIALGKNMSFYMLIPVFSKLTKFISIPLQTSKLSIDEYGLISLFSNISSIISIFLLLSLHNAITRFYYDFIEDENKFKQFLGTVLLFLLVFDFIVLAIISLTNKLGIIIGIESSFLIKATIYSIICKPIMFSQSILRLKNNSKKFTIISISKEIIITVLIIISLLIFDKNMADKVIYAMILGETFFSIYAIKELVGYACFKVNMSYLKEALKYSLPLLPYSLNGFILNASDRLIINKMEGITSTGKYSFAYVIASILSLIVGSLDQAWLPMMYKKLKIKETNSVNNMLEIITFYVTIFTILLMTISPELTFIFGGNKYVNIINIIPIAISSIYMLFIANRFTYILLYEKKTALLSLTTLGSGVVNIILNIVFIGKYGYIAAIWTTLFSYMLYAYLNYKVCKIIIDDSILMSKSSLIYSCIITVYAISLMYIFTTVNNYFYRVAILFFAILAFIFIKYRPR